MANFASLSPATILQGGPEMIGLLAQQKKRMAANVATKPRATYGLSMNFSVVIGWADLGDWQTCSGLKVEFVSKEIQVGGGVGRVVLIPDTVKYQKISLTRAMSATGSNALRSWLSSTVQAWDSGDHSRPDHCTITLKDDGNVEVASWELRNVIPLAWTGPSMNAAKHDMAMETLDLMHGGFL